MVRTILAVAALCALVLCSAFAAQKAIPKADSPHPEILEKTTPKYPPEAKKEKVSGPVVLEILIDTEGRVTEARAANEADPRLVKAAVEAVKQWKFKPVLKDDKPVVVKAKITVNFQLK